MTMPSGKGLLNAYRRLPSPFGGRKCPYSSNPLKGSAIAIADYHAALETPASATDFGLEPLPMVHTGHRLIRLIESLERIAVLDPRTRRR